MKFEGEYLNGKKWNGKGYTKGGKIDFEIKEGKGKGKEYTPGDRLLFEGNYLNGERNGKGKEYNFRDSLIFEGEYLNGQRWNGKFNKYEYINGKTIINENKEKNIKCNIF